jgi:long-subunit fatty acid transport protein
MKKLIVLLAALSVASWSLAGGLNRSAATGPTDIGNGSDPSGPWFPHNLGSKIQLREPYLVEVGAELMIPKFTYRDFRGQKFTSKNVAHPMPYFSFAERLNEKLVVGVDVSTDYGLGASFKDIAFGMDSRTLVSGTYVKPYFSLQLTDRLSVGVGPVLCLGMLTWNGPFDINRHPTPIRVGTDGWGVGSGYQVGAMYQATDELAFGVNYLSPVTVDLEGCCRATLGLIHYHDDVKAKFQFPDRFDFSVGYQPQEDWLIVGQVSYFGYSRNSLGEVPIVFQSILYTKPVKTNWQDNIAIYLGASHKLDEHWTIGGGIGYMSKAIDGTADFMTPDVIGFDVAGRVKYSYQNFDLTAALSRGWGENHSHGRDITADIYTVSLAGTWRF